MPREMALVGEARGGRGLRQGDAFAGMTVMCLVRMQDQHLPRPARPQAAAIVELLDVVEGEPDPVGLVPVQVIGMAAESPFEALPA